MRKTSPVLLLLVAASLTGCPSNAHPDSGTPGNDAYVAPGVDTGVPDMDSGGTPDSGVPPTDITLASLVNPSAADHPTNPAGLLFNVTDGNLIALTTRLYISTSASGRCTYAAWVGTPAGGNYSGIEVVDSFVPPTGMDCFSAPAHNIPDTLQIGDAVTTLVADFSNYCPGSNCPANTSQELNVTNGTFTVGSHVGDGTPTTVAISDIGGVALEVGARGIELQGALVTIENVEIVELPLMGSAPAGNNYVMDVVAAGTTTPDMHIQVSKYPGVGCQRTALTSMGTGATLSRITGVLQYSFNKWTIQVRQPSDMPDVVCSDAGTDVDAGL